MMHEMILLSALLFVFSTYKLFLVLKNKETPKGNRMVAWLLYGVIMLAVAIVNVVYYT